MAPAFGTSGLRGLVADLTDGCIDRYVSAFAARCETGTGLFVGHDLRPSSLRIAATVTETARARGLTVTNCAAVPTPALALAAMRAGAAAIMVTGSHIPADRNGLKFYTPSGEITKNDESAILAALGTPPSVRQQGRLVTNPDAGRAWTARYLSAFGPQALGGLRIGLWSHSAVGFDLLPALFADLGAAVIELGRTDTFLAVDTEALPAALRQKLSGWVRRHALDALISTDADGDRPLLADEQGRIVAGDVMGQITARFIGAETIVTPLTANSGVSAANPVAKVIRTKVGSPHVLAAMQAHSGKTIGYEANGGFLLGFDAALPAGNLPALATRDSLLPLLATLCAARKTGLSQLVANQPQRFTATDRLQNAPRDVSTAVLARLAIPDSLTTFLSPLGEALQSIDQTDGIRIHLASDRTLHLRASGNAPELRVYVEAETPAHAARLLRKALAALRPTLAS